jgi:hypothetical protein
LPVQWPHPSSDGWTQFGTTVESCSTAAGFIASRRHGDRR